MLTAPPAEDAYQRGVGLLAQGRPDQAVPSLRDAVRLAPKNAQYWKALGVAFASMNQLRDSTEPFRQACTLDPELLDACYYLGRNLYALDQYEQALVPLRQAFEHDAVKGRAEAAIGQCLEALGRDQQAETHYRAAVARGDRARQQARIAYGRFLVRQGRATEALPVLQAAQEPASYEASYEIGLAYMQSDHLDDAVRALRRATELDSRQSAARLLLAKVYRRLGRDSEAEREEKAAIAAGLPEQR